jgi:aryl carrier-like protein
LPAPDLTNSNLATDFTTARNTVEEQLANIWADVLRVPQVGIYDNFFELGGDSILSIQIIAKANQAGLNLTPKLLFQHPNIAELAQMCGAVDINNSEPKIAYQSDFSEFKWSQWNQADIDDILIAIGDV